MTDTDPGQREWKYTGDDYAPLMKVYTAADPHEELAVTMASVLGEESVSVTFDTSITQ